MKYIIMDSRYAVNDKIIFTLRSLTHLVLFLLTSCGFTPMLAHEDGAVEHFGSRLIVESVSKDGTSYVVHMMRQRLKNILSGLGLDSTYKIHVRLSEESGNLSYANDATATRSMMRMLAQIIISQNGQTVYETKLASVTSYSQTTNDEFVNQSAVQGAQERLIESLSIDISREMQRFAKTDAQGGKIL